MASSFREYTPSRIEQLEQALSGERHASDARLGRDQSPVVNLELRIKAIIRARAERFNFFPQALFADPAWDILLELALAEEQQRRVSTSALCAGAHVPATTAARWIKSMEEQGWLERLDCRFDARVKYVQLTRHASSKLRAYLLQIGDNAVL